jgi:hypothetical protein
VQLGTMVSLLAGRVGFSGIFPVSIGVALAVGSVLLHQAGFKQSSLWFVGELFCLTIILSLALSAFFFDFSWDGQWYHQTAIIHIARDWNPLSDPMHNFAPHLETWERHYAKGPWYFAAAVYQATGHIEWGKAINWIALAASFSAVLAACLSAGIRRLDAFGIATVIAFNPVVMSEVTSSLVDAVMISFLVVAASALFTCLAEASAPPIVAGVAGAIVCTNAKFTGLVYLCFPPDLVRSAPKTMAPEVYRRDRSIAISCRVCLRIQTLPDEHLLPRPAFLPNAWLRQIPKPRAIWRR